MVQRYKFESKSQLLKTCIITKRCCFQWFKGTNLKANHNMYHGGLIYEKLFPMVQRYKFESKSQPAVHRWVIQLRCFQWFKGTNLKANHNPAVYRCVVQLAVSNGSKVQIWKQITTLEWKKRSSIGLFPMVQRYKFESKSQQDGCRELRDSSCFQWFKGTNLKANHNTPIAF